MRRLGGLAERLRVALLCALGLLLVFVSYSAEIGVSEFTLRAENGTEEVVELPFLRSGIGRQVYVYSGTIDQRLLSPDQYRITPDNEILRIVINGKPLDLSDYSKPNLSDFRNGVLIDLSDAIQFGENSVEIVVADYGGDMGLSIQADRGLLHSALLVLWTVYLLAVFNEIWRVRETPVSHRALYALIILGGILRVWIVFTYNPAAHIWSDAERHWSQGIDTLRIDLMSQTDPIMYQIYVGLLGKLTLKLPELVAFYTSLLSLLTPWLWYKFLRELQSSKAIALAGWAIFSFLPSWVSIYSYFMQETLLLPLIGAALWATWRARRKATVSSFLVMVLLWIIAGLTRGIAIPLAAVCCLYLWMYQGEKLKRALYSTAMLVMILGPLAYRNYQAVGVLAPHGLGYLASLYALSGKREILLRTERQGAKWVHVFGSPSMGAEPFAPLSDWTTQRSGRFVVDVDLDEGSRDWNAAYERVSRPLTDNLWIIKENLIFLFFAASWPDSNPARAVDVINIHMRWIWFPLTCLALVFTLMLWRTHRRYWLLPLLLLTWFVVQGLLPISVNEGRYRKPFEGLLICQCLLLIALRRGKGCPGNMIGIPFLKRTAKNSDVKSEGHVSQG